MWYVVGNTRAICAFLWIVDSVVRISTRLQTFFINFPIEQWSLAILDKSSMKLKDHLRIRGAAGMGWEIGPA